MHLEIVDSSDVGARASDALEVIPIAVVSGTDQVLCAVDDPAVSEEEEKERQAILLDEGQFMFLPEARERVAQHVHVAGPSGSGKSTWAGNFARQFRAQGGRVIVISADEADDPAIPLKDACDDRLALTEDLEAVKLDEISDCKTPLLLVFDDVEGVPAELQKALETFRKAAVERGRKYGISTVNIFHRAAAGRATRDALGEATAFVCFPRGGLSKNTRYALTEYAGQHPDLASRLRRRHWGRTVVVTNTCPQVAIGDRAAALLDYAQFKKRP